MPDKPKVPELLSGTPYVMKNITNKPTTNRPNLMSQKFSDRH
ncbi:hypothetical protein HMPREF9370_1467 [Neisseria wadsworthii 9715]|uniref:Uncharacterized protein n=1 Tax=Neisseria wadsworthii 9715 TaxID=1030841 RepID=G4CQV7_9NEIS|nr:hypothetical protein HMPREF9370_1467 [Neisseria wadsworthii 9715]